MYLHLIIWPHPLPLILSAPLWFIGYNILSILFYACSALITIIWFIFRYSPLNSYPILSNTPLFYIFYLFSPICSTRFYLIFLLHPNQLWIPPSYISDLILLFWSTLNTTLHPTILSCLLFIHYYLSVLRLFFISHQIRLLWFLHSALKLLLGSSNSDLNNLP